MILKLQNDSAVRLHFTHFQHENPRRTEVEIFDLGISESYSIGQGVTYCHSTDQFCRAIGRKIALQRAIEHLPREARTQIWKAYFDFVDNAGK